MKVCVSDKASLGPFHHIDNMIVDCNIHMSIWMRDIGS